ncbi:hypothetical protein GH885_11150 [Gracilibacillus thailandensis]|uniref:Uncharacterized protein n=1 Tax=Gracilibacillus thailandensis TaxID=563735 RepID=A0A6N7R2G3_9BACI|nr:hypothetical protein [Gracilibacillus thailandensis]
MFGKRKHSLFFLFLFLFLLILEAGLAFLIYNETGEISTFQIVITIFVIYACTFGINDFKKLDRWMRIKVGKWRGVDLLTEKDKAIMKKQQDPKYIAKINRYSAIAHLLIFVIVQTGFWLYGLGDFTHFSEYITDFSWIGTEDLEKTPYPNETLYRISMLWGLIFIVDFIWSMSYTIFPAKG